MYLLDSNVFIQAKNLYYGFDICPGFWDWMDQATAGHAVHTITKVYDELVDGNDDLAKWIKDRKDDGRFLAISDPKTQAVFAQVVVHVQGGPYHDPAKRDFLSKADPWLIAKAKIMGATVVTLEQPAPDAKKRVPLPDICDAFQVPYMDTFKLLRNKAAVFGLLAS